MDFEQRTKLLIDDEKLTSGTVLVCGLGGVGSFTAEALVRMGVGHLIVCDNDNVNTSNINRQLLALHSTVGRLKVEVAKERYMDINPELDLHVRNTFILPENAEAFFDGLEIKPDFVADCIDTVSGKLAIISECKKRNIPVISCMGTGNKLHPEMFKISDIKKTSVCPLCRVMRRELKTRGIDELPVLYSTEEPKKTEAENTGEKLIGSIATVPSVAGLMIANYIAEEMTK